MFDDKGVSNETRPADDAAGAQPLPGGQPDLTSHGIEAEIHLREVVRSIVASLVDEPDAVVVASKRREHSVYLNLRVADGELGKVIGRQGRTARAIRTAVQIAGARHDVRVSLDIEG